ncbi:M20 aminoacylase family protein [Aurantimonas sp. HBX-1]|uniref:M20 aminoacylase family protein n=1 Tax=Aurantimonas sp. HBX-1 TaxID=2906072 RepID=UPI001F225741|nr:M20 aminoacylase family protein [Aurantimonas sp. HBX-1]UIJ72379.1 M20 family metallopeptidase [Aurantimonas sp. HBX-1]
MPVNNRIAESQPEIAAWRHHLHANPEILYDVVDTAAFVAGKLREFGCDEVATGIGRTGVVGLIHGRGGAGGPVIGLRADMDALPIVEETGLAYASGRPGAMHACGHDGHTAMLLGAARSLAESRAFDGTVALIFQPAEEGGAGAKAMMEDGLFARWPIGRVFGMHNRPGLAVGKFGIRAGGIMASTDEFIITVKGRGGHAALPHSTVDPIPVAAALVQALQTIAGRNADPLKSLVVSVTQVHAGFAHNVIPDTAVVSGTARSLDPAMRDLAEERLRGIAAGICAAHGAAVDIDFDRNYPITINDAAEASFCAAVAGEIVGPANVDPDIAPMMAGEDFSYMLEEKPGAYIFIGNGDSASLHNPAYDFCDDAIAFGASFWVRLAERALSRN